MVPLLLEGLGFFEQFAQLFHLVFVFLCISDLLRQFLLFAGDGLGREVVSDQQFEGIQLLQFVGIELGTGVFLLEPRGLVSELQQIYSVFVV